MSVWYESKIIKKDIIRRLTDAGCLVDNILDLKKCGPIEAEKYRNYLMGKGYSEDKINEIMNRHVYINNSHPNEIIWSKKWVPDETIGHIIAEFFKDEVLIYHESCDCSSYVVTFAVNQHGICTKDGINVEKVIPRMKNTLIKKIDDNTSCVSLPVYEEDKYFSKIYVKNEFINNHDYINGTSEYSDVFFKSKTDRFPVYRIDRDGNKIKEYMSAEELINKIEICKKEYAAKVKFPISGIKRVKKNQYDQPYLSMIVDKTDMYPAVFYPTRPFEFDATTGTYSTGFDNIYDNIYLYRTLADGTKLREEKSPKEMQELYLKQKIY